MIRFPLILPFLLVVSTELLFSQNIPLRDTIQSKLAPSLRLRKEDSNVRIQISNPDKFMNWVSVHLPRAKFEKQLSNVYSIKGASKADIDKLITSPWVKFIDRADRKAQEEKALGPFDLTLNRISAVHLKYPLLTGENLNASIKEKPFDQEDIDLKNRIVLNNQFDEAYTLHATTMATIIAGAGNSEPSGKGAAKAAGVTTSDFDQLLPDDGNELLALGVTVQNHSYGVGIENYYGIESSEYDKHCVDFPNIVHVFSSGNEGDQADVTGSYSGITGFANLTGQFKVSKNTLSIGSADAAGNVVTRSSRGPAHDGRIKPELIAFGDAGSSEAAAVVSGITLLMQQAYKDKFSLLPSSSLIKAILINSADDTGRPEVDFETGFGNADALGAIRTIEQERFFTGNSSQGGETIHSINVPVNTYQLKVTLAWIDVEGATNATQALVNDLDLIVRNVLTGIEVNPWVLNHYPKKDSLLLPAKRKEDHLNNVEQVTIQFPSSGDYELLVKGFSIPQGSQSYSLVFEYESGFEWINPVLNTSFESQRNNLIRWRWSDLPATGKLEYKFVDDTEWIEINNAVNLENQYFPWLTPDTTALVQLRMTVNSTEYESEIFSIVKPIALKTGYNCTDEVMLVWGKIPAAQQYQLYTLGEKYLEPFLLTPDTFAILNSLQKEMLEYAVAPVMDGMTFITGSTADYTKLGTGCYLISFLPQQYIINNDALFNLKIGTTHKLQSVRLEHLENSFWIEVQTVSPVTTTNIVLTHADPKPETNLYRARLVADNNVSVYSNEEEVFYARNTDLFVYPNPIVHGESLSIIVSDQEAVRIRLYDIFGRPIRETTDPGAIKTIDTGALLKGTYILEVLKANGKKITTRLLVL